MQHIHVIPNNNNGIVLLTAYDVPALLQAFNLY